MHGSLYHTFHLKNSQLTIFHSFIWSSMSYGFHMNCSFHHIYFYSMQHIYDIDFFFKLLTLLWLKNFSYFCDKNKFILSIILALAVGHRSTWSVIPETHRWFVLWDWEWISQSNFTSKAKTEMWDAMRSPFCRGFKVGRYPVLLPVWDHV